MTRRMKTSTIPSRIWQQLDYEMALQSLMTPRGLRASDGELFSAIFGRDSLQAGLDLVEWYRDIAFQIVISLAKFQGLENNEFTEEAPGRIFHELRLLDFGLGRINARQRQILEELSRRWGKPRWLKNKRACVSYGSVDATFLFVTLCARLGPTILATEFRHASGRVMTLRQSVMAALDWCLRQISPTTGLVEFQRVSPNGHPFPVMRDGLTAHLHLDGSVANYHAPVATLDLQFIAHTALRDTELLLGTNAPSGLEQIRARLQDQTFRLFSMPGRTFAMALDRDDDGNLRQVQTQTSVEAEMLESTIFEGLTAPERQAYIEAIVRRMYSDDFLTPIGIRMRALSQAKIVPYWDYQGAYTSWPVINGRFARGLRATTLVTLAQDMEARVMNAINISGVPYEFYAVDGKGRVHYDVTGMLPMEREVVIATNESEHMQTWTISTALHALRVAGQPTGPIESWADELAQDILHDIKPMELLVADKLEEMFPKKYGFRIDTDAGKAAEAAFSRNWRITNS